MVSLARHLSRPRRCTIHVLVASSDWSLAEDLIVCFKRELREDGISAPRVQLHEMQPVRFNVSGLARMNPGRENLVRAPQTLARVYLQEYLRTAGGLPRRALWLDTDTVVKADVAPLFRMHMRHALGAIWLTGVNTGLKTQVSLRHPALRSLSLYAGLPAFNTGVLLDDLARWSAGHLTRELEYWISHKDSASLFKEGVLQGPMNLVFQDNFDRIDWRWNVYGLGFWAYRLPPACLDESRILHWTGTHKAWLEHGFHKDLFERPRFCKFRHGRLLGPATLTG
eukprot:TRINITY_DN7987_c0_g2_i1.p1 TRINITY_DN7987_c0_g2~~TRINITY_DN7987_c0_g2_i1.p1  ORF type:complete len:282 (-),score=17.16 TRINITY_DN7987_c0_g2_i1:349-1194(-)